MKSKVALLAVAVLAGFSITGCSEKTEEAAETAVTGAAQDTQRNVEKTGDAVARGAENAAQATEKAAEGAAREVEDAGQVVGWTTKVKNALIADPKIAAYNLNVDSSGEHDTVTIMGTAPSQAEKARITQIAQKATEGKAKIQNNVTVGQSASR